MGIHHQLSGAKQGPTAEPKLFNFPADDFNDSQQWAAMSDPFRTYGNSGGRSPQLEASQRGP